MKITELPAPEGLSEETWAKELIRVWVVDGEKHFQLATNSWGDSKAWSLLLRDLVLQVARSVSEVNGIEYKDVLKLIYERAE